MNASGRSLPARLQRAFARAFGALMHGDRRSAFVRELFYRLAARFTPAIVVESQGLRYLMSTGDHGTGMTLFMGLDVDQDNLGHALAALAEAGCESPAGKTMIDIGANVGTSSVVALGSHGFARVVCFEPLPRNRELLSLNLILNGFEDRAAIHGVALSDREGTATFEIAPRNPADARVRVDGAVSGPGDLGEEGWETIEVPTATLDSFVASGEVDLDSVGLLWIDAQGHEAQILAGAQQLLARKLPAVIEFWPYGLRRAGGFDALLGTISDNYREVLDLGREGASRRPAAEVAVIGAEYTGFDPTDLLLIP